MGVEQRYLEEEVMAIKVPKRRIRANETHNYQDMNDVMLPVVEEMGRLNEHNFSNSMQAQLTLTDMSNDVAFNVDHGYVFVDVSSNPSGGAAGSQLIEQSQLWEKVHPDELSKRFSTADGGMFRFIASGQYTAVTSVVGAVERYLQFGFKVDGTVLPDSIIGDLDVFESDSHMETGLSGLFGAFLLDFTLYLSPGIHTVDVVMKTDFRDQIRDVDLYIYGAEAFYWEMAR
tara:strand:+ start:1510 stop:2199 length:690 start_codon:yes stop_codon:yes gene_type:complete